MAGCGWLSGRLLFLQLRIYGCVVGPSDCFSRTVCACVSQDGLTPLYDACARGDSAIAKVLLAVSGINPNMALAVGRMMCEAHACLSLKWHLGLVLPY